METVDLKYLAAGDSPVEICFEPVGTTFRLTEGQSIFLRVPLEALPKIEVVVWANGIGVWLPYPGDYVVLDSDGKELDRL
ncbi:hypothetical protein ACWEIJ_45770 [Lentzea sp. NPDC004789]